MMEFVATPINYLPTYGAANVETGGTWGVWDRLTDKPARLGGGDLRGCTSQRAETAHGVVSRIYKGGLEAIVVGVSNCALTPISP